MFRYAGSYGCPRAVVVLVLLLSSSGLFAAGEPEPELGDPREFREQFLAEELSWEAVVDRAEQEGEVEFYHWGGSEALNNWIELSARPDIEQYGIELNANRADTANVVDIILADAAAGRGLGEGSVDFVWINGENFRTLKENDLLFGPFADKLPNSQYFFLDPDDPRSTPNLYDFGTATELKEIPWSSAQFTFRVDTARVDREDIPADFSELETWMRTNPGRFTYVAPPQYIGTTFVQSVMYGKNPGEGTYESFQAPPEEFDPAELAALMKPAFEYLRRIEPFLLGGGGEEGRRGSPSYPSSASTLEARFTGGEVDFSMEFGVYDVDREIRSGNFPETVRNIIFPESGMIADKSFLAIPANAPNPAAALVAVNALSAPESHLSKLTEIGYGLGIDLPLLQAQLRERVEEEAPDLRGVTADQLSEAEVPNVNAGLVPVIDEVWLEYIAEHSSRPFEEIVYDAWSAVVE